MVVRRTNYVLDTEFGTLVARGNNGVVKNVTEFSALDAQLRPTDWRRVQFTGEPVLARGLEDARLLSRGDRWYLSGVMLEKHTPRARMAVYELHDDMTARLVEKYDGPVESRPEKNWTTTLYADTDGFEFIREQPDGLRGGSSLVPFEDGYLTVGHYTYLKKVRYYSPLTFGVSDGIKRSYTHVLCRYDKQLRLTGISEQFTLRPVKGIEFVSGLVLVDDKLVFSYGVDDKESWLATLPLDKIEDIIKEK